MDVFAQDSGEPGGLPGIVASRRELERLARDWTRKSQAPLTPRGFFNVDLPALLQRQRSRGTACISLRDRRRSAWTVDLEQGAVAAGRRTDVDFTLDIMPVDFMRLLRNDLDLADSWRRGRFTFSGDLAFLSRLSSLMGDAAPSPGSASPSTQTQQLPQP